MLAWTNLEPSKVGDSDATVTTSMSTPSRSCTEGRLSQADRSLRTFRKEEMARIKHVTPLP